MGCDPSLHCSQPSPRLRRMHECEYISAARRPWISKQANDWWTPRQSRRSDHLRDNRMSCREFVNGAVNRRNPILGGKQMYNSTGRLIAAAAFAMTFAASAASAQDTVRVRGAIERVDGPTYVIKTRDGGEAKVTLADNALVVGIVKASVA